MKKIIGMLFIIFGLSFSISVLAHNPRLVYNTTTSYVVPYQIENPELSQAFYGELKGFSDYYQIKSETGFNLYVNIVVPAISGSKTDFQVVILDTNGNVIKILDGLATEWTEFYEEFAGDLYYRGPEWENEVGAGTYTIIVSNVGNQGKYSLAVGKIERFTIKDMAHTLAVLGNLKTEFFGKPLWTMFWNFTGIFLLVLLVALFVLILVIRKIVSLFLRKSVKNVKQVTKVKKISKISNKKVAASKMVRGTKKK